MSSNHSVFSCPDPNSQDSQSDIIRRPYVRPELKLNITPTPKHWVLTSKEEDLDINEDDGYVLSANGDGSGSGAFIPCDALSGISNARPGRPRAKPQILHRRRVSGIATSPTLSDMSSPTTSFTNSRIRHLLPPTPSTPDTDFKKLCNSMRLFDVSPVATRSRPKDAPDMPLVSPPIAPVLSRTPSTPRQLRPVLYVKTSSPVGTSPPPPTPALPSPQFRPSGRLLKRPAIPVWPPEYYPRAVAV
ncbi:hypothetical protein BJY52DRAFT_1209622 [Lactarius psammicola]|nr:hypothetical protein BJY52DRAFT_1209622 [Lactarius psammicola]